MLRRSSPIGVVAIASGLLVNAAPALATSAETWVSATGSNAGGCPITAPCKTFSYAYGQTSSGGAINVLSSGNYGPLSISKSISIVADGVEAVINATGVSIAGSNIVVSLRGLTIDHSGVNGISFAAGAALQIQNCVIRRANTGINFIPASGTSELHISDSVIANTASAGIAVVPTGSGSAKVVLNRVRVENGLTAGIGFAADATTGSIIAAIRDSVAAGNSGHGIFAIEGGSGRTEVMVDRSALVNNGTGIGAHGAVAKIRIGDSTVSGNTTGLFTFGGGVIESYGTNKVRGNTTDGAPTTTVLYK